MIFLVGQRLEAYLKDRQSSGIRPVQEDNEAVNVSMHLRLRSLVSLVSTSSKFHVLNNKTLKQNLIYYSMSNNQTISYLHFKQVETFVTFMHRVVRIEPIFNV